MIRSRAKFAKDADKSRADGETGAPLDTAALRVEFRPLADLLPYARNSRKHSSEQLSQLAASIVEFGWTNPVLADARGIVAGHGRVAAARLLYDQNKSIRLPNGQPVPSGCVPVIDCTGWSDAQRRAYVIADNQLALTAEWDKQLLAVELEDLATEGFDLDLLGFPDDELRKLQAIWNEQQDGAGGSDGKNFAPVVFGVVIECDNEPQQETLLAEFLERGLKCRALL